MPRLETREEIKDRYYRKVEAMYRQHIDDKDIIRQCSELNSFEVWEIIQDIFHKDMEAKRHRKRNYRSFA